MTSHSRSNSKRIDPGDDLVESWDIDWGDGETSLNLGSGISSATHTYVEPGVYTVEVSVVDSDSTPNVASTTTFDVTVGLGSDAVVADPNGSYQIEEGESLELLGTAVGSPVTLEWDLNGDGTFGDASGVGSDIDVVAA